ncbi:MAG: ATP synthase F1 subunit delta [Candidatus Zixiibacteriota bacterium]
MLAQQVAKKYSTALFELARERNLLDTAWEQFDALAGYLKKDRTLLDFMEAPQVSDEKKLALIEKAFANRLDKPFYDFLLVLVDKRRFKFIPDIIEHFDNLVREEKSIARAICISAVPLTDAERNKLVQNLQKKTSLKIELEEKVDKTILGGMVVMLRNQIIDGSIRHSLDLLRNRLLKVKVH